MLLSKEIYEDFEIAITYGFEEFPYVNFEHLNDYLKSNNESLRDLDYGYDRNDIEVIFNVMKWMEENSEYINELNSFCDKESYHEL